MDTQLTLVADRTAAESEDATWRDQAACLGFDSSVFFPEEADAAGAARAKEVCGSCPVAEHCLEWALETNQTEGVWGGSTPFERRRIRRRRTKRIREAG